MSISKRWLLLGDSIQSLVYGATVPSAGSLTANQIPALTGISIHNVSAPGNTIANAGGSASDFSLDANLNVLNLLRGTALPDGVICFLGTNDYGHPAISGLAFIQAYTRLVRYCKSNGMKFVGVTPFWRSDETNPVAHIDGPRVLQDFRSWVFNVIAQESVGFEDSVKCIHYFDLGLSPECFYDGIHLNEMGHETLAPNLVAKMQSIGFWN